MQGATKLYFAEPCFTMASIFLHAIIWFVYLLIDYISEWQTGYRNESWIFN